MKNTVIYARYSSHNQTEQSIEGQLRECNEYARREELTIVGQYIDRAISGTTDKRPQFLKMINDSSTKKFQYILVYQLNRFSRDKHDSVIYKRILKKNGVRILSTKENITDGPAGGLMEGIFESLDQYYSEELGQKIQRGMKESALKCQSFNAAVPLGYYVDSTKHFQIDSATAPTVKKIFQMYIKGQTMADITRYLNSKNLKTSRGNEYGKNSIRGILQNKRYIGFFLFKDMEIEGGIPAIISKDIFEKAQHMLQKNKKAPARNKAEDAYLLTTKLYCGLCKHNMVGISGRGRSGKKYSYYICTDLKDRHNCSKKRISKEKLENLVVTATKEILTDEQIEKIARNVISYAKSEQDSSPIKRLEKNIRDNEKATQNLVKVLEKGTIDDFIIEQISKRREELSHLKAQLAEEQGNIFNLTVPQVKLFMRRFQNGDINDLKYRKALIDVFVRKVVLKEKRMAIYYNVQEERSLISLIENPLSEDEGYSNGHMVEHTGVEPVAS